MMIFNSLRKVNAFSIKPKTPFFIQLFRPNFAVRYFFTINQTSCVTRNLMERKKGDNKAKGGKGGKKDDDEEEKELDWEEYKTGLKEVVEHYTGEIGQLKLGRAQTSLIDQLGVNLNGQTYSLASLAQITVVDGNTLGVTVFDQNNQKQVLTVLKDHEIGFGVTSNARMILLSIPKPTNEVKTKLIKMANELTEKARIQIRGTRRKLMDTLKEMGMTKDDERKATQTAQTLHDDYIKIIDEKLKVKEKEFK
jgi:ribosome recycling factor